MRYNPQKIINLSESYINGNVKWVKDEVKTINKLEFVFLCAEIIRLKDNADINEIAFQLTS
jgi:hypothetical protein